jgi:hypothetical protein
MATANNGQLDTTSDARSNHRTLATSAGHVQNILREDFELAKERVGAATGAFDAATKYSTASAPLRRTELMHNASREVTIARMEMLRAHHRLSDFLNAGIVPDDLKHSG